MLSAGIHHETDPAFLPEVWAWYAIGCLTVLLRYITRIRTVGFRGLQGDDWVMALAFVLYTMDAVLVDLVYYHGANVDVTAETVDILTPEDIAILTIGSKAELAAWYSYTALIWCMKFSMLFFYQRLTFGTIQNSTVRYIFWICGVTYVAVFCTITFGCQPFQENWQVSPLPSRVCAFKPQNLWTTVILNVITDAIILVIPIPMLWRLKVSWSRKFAIAALLSSGLFVISAAVVRAALTLGSAPSAININRWGVRETIIGLLTVNIPILRPMITSAFWRSGPYDPTGVHGSFGDEGPYSGPRSSTAKNFSGKKVPDGTFELRSQSGDTDGDEGKSPVIRESGPRAGDSEDEILRESEVNPYGGVTVSHGYEVQSKHRDEEASIEWHGKEFRTKVTTEV